MVSLGMDNRLFMILS